MPFNKRQLPKRKSQRALMYLRLYPLEARVYRDDEGIWTASIPAASVSMTERVCGDENEIMRLIVRGPLFLI